MSITFKSNVIKLLSGSVLVQVINLAMQPIITRLYSPADYGVLSFVTSVVGVAAIVGFFSYERAIPIVKENSHAFSLVKSLLIYAVYLTVFLLMIFGLGYLLVNFNFKPSLLFIGVFLFVIGLSDSVLTNLNYKMGDYGSVAKRKVIVAICAAVIQISLGILNYGAEGLLISLLFCSCLGVYLIGKKYFLEIVRSKFATKDLFWQYRRLAIIETPQNLINSFSIQFPVFFISHYYGAAVTGQYGLAMKLIAVPALLITSSFSDVFTQNFAKLYNNKQNFHDFTVKIWKKLIMLGFIPTIIIMLFGPFIFTFIFGAKWHMAGQIAQIMCVSTWIAILSGTTLFAFMIMNKGKIMFIYSSLLFISRAVGMYILIHNLWLGLIFYVASEVIIRLVWLYLLNSTMLQEYKSFSLKV